MLNLLCQHGYLDGAAASLVLFVAFVSAVVLVVVSVVELVLLLGMSGVFSGPVDTRISTVEPRVMGPEEDCEIT